MSDETTRKIIAKAMPKARIIERSTAAADSAAPKSDSFTPETEALVRKYGGNVFLRSGVGADTDALSGLESTTDGAEEDIDSAEVEIESGSKRASRRVLLIDKGKKRIIGTSG